VYKTVTDHSVIHPGGEEAIDGGWIDQLPVIGKDHPEQKNHKLKKCREKTHCRHHHHHHHHH